MNIRKVPNSFNLFFEGLSIGTLKILFIYGVGLLLLYGNYFANQSNLMAFIIMYVIIFVVARPKRSISPLSIFYIYYGLWFVVAPLFAERYQGEFLHSVEYSLAFALAYTLFGLGVLCLRWGENSALVSNGSIYVSRPLSLARTRFLVFVLYITSTLLVALIVLASGGLSVWLTDPGDAFLNRGGSGVFVILSHFSSLALAALSGYLAFRQRKMLPIFLFLLWVALTSPIHGSKFQISLLTILLFLPWLRELRFFSFRSGVLYASLVGIFFLGLYFRNLAWLEISTIVPYALNYFTALENLAVSLRDFEPQFMFTFFLPFVKFLTPFGLEDQSMYFDMNHLLTDIYFPEAWAIRATEQWPVETDLYLNFFFFGGLPIFSFYLFFIGWIYGRALRSNSLGAWFAAIVMMLFMISHLRGSLINHTDFYMYPYIFAMYLIFRSAPIIRSNK